MKLSVVIPVYNGAAFIEKSYQSILSQQLSDFEIIYVDNNSKDASVEYIKRLQAKDYRVKLYHEPKKGAGPTRNLGIDKSCGDYIYMLDIDDEIFPNALNKMLSVLESYPKIDAVFGKMVKSHKRISETLITEDDSMSVVIKEKPYWGLKWFSSLKYVVGPPAFLYRASVFKIIGKYNEDLRLGQDTAFDIKLGMLRNIAFLDMHIYLYFKHGKSTTDIVKQHTPRAFMVWPRLVKEHLPFYLKHDTPKVFEKLLFRQLFLAIGRQIVFTKGLQARIQLKKQLLGEMQPIKIPWYLHIYLAILIILPIEILRKVYGYYLVPFAVKRLCKKK